jgi:hypothetical protein
MTSVVLDVLSASVSGNESITSSENLSVVASEKEDVKLEVD